MPQFGSGSNLVSQNLSQTVDNQGNPIISSDTTFGASPLGYAARVQALFGLPNATFELTPPDTTLTIDEGNQLPYWDVQEYSEGVMTATAVYDDTTNTWGVKLDPGTATTDDYLTMTTRSYLVNDDNLSLRQKALAVVSKNGTYAGTTQWNLELTASYYDATNTLLHSGTVATIYDNTTWTSMSGTTTTGGTAINGAAHYVDLTYTLTATAPVTSATSVTLKSTLLQTSAGAGGGGAQSFLVTETFTSSDTWTVPTGVTNLIAVVAIGAGQGGKSGSIRILGQRAASQSSTAGTIGKGGDLVLARDISLGTAASVSVSVGAGGAGGAGTSYTKAIGDSTSNISRSSGNASNGGNTSFGSFVVAAGGGNNNSGTPSYSTTWGANIFTQTGAAQTIPAGTTTTTSFPYYPYEFQQAGTSGVGTFTVSGTASSNDVSSFGTAGARGAAGLLGAGGNSAANTVNTPAGTASTTGTVTSGSGGSGGDGAAGGAGGAAVVSVISALVGGIGKTYTITGGTPGTTAGSANGAGGAAGGGVAIGVVGIGTSQTTSYTNSEITATVAGATSGSNGLVVIAYVA
jgi:hypothetical protein